MAHVHVTSFSPSLSDSVDCRLRSKFSLFLPWQKLMVRTRKEVRERKKEGERERENKVRIGSFEF